MCIRDRNYSKQLIAVRAMQDVTAEANVEDLFGPEYLVERPLLAAIRAGAKAVLLVDELDRADDEFEAFLLEVLSEFAVTIPEIGRAGADDLDLAVERRVIDPVVQAPALEREIEI